MIGAAEAADVVVPLASAVGGVVIAFLVAVLVGVLVRSLAKRSVVASDLARRSRRPLRAVLVVIAVWVALRISVPAATWRDSDWMGAIGHLLLIALIATATWLVGTLAFVVEDVALSRYRVDVKDNRHARRVRTQVQLLRRITVAVLVLVGLAAVLLTFPGVSAFGASLLASAGVLSVVAGLAAQSSLANVFAGLQIAFTDGIRVDDVVVVEEEWGRIEEITLTYVVVHVWDDRRLILPSTYFTQTPFENWTRRAAELLGTVELDVDWQVPVDDMRAELNRLLAATDLWDQRVGVLQVTDAVGGAVRLRALASAVDAPTLFDLRCYLREGLVAWLQRSAPQGLPRTRIETSTAAALPAGAPTPTALLGGDPAAEAVTRHGAPDGPDDDEPRPTTGQLDARLFTGTVEAIERSRSFAGPGQDVIDEREEHAAEARRAEPEPTTGRSTGGRRVQVVSAPGQGAEGEGAGAVAASPADAAPATEITPAVPADDAVPACAVPVDDAVPEARATTESRTERLDLGDQGSARSGSPDAAAESGTMVLPGGAADEPTTGDAIGGEPLTGVLPPTPAADPGGTPPTPTRRSVRSLPVDPDQPRR